MEGHTDFDTAKDIPSLAGKVIFITGGMHYHFLSPITQIIDDFTLGTAGLGAESIRVLAAHSPKHIYFTGRNVTAADALISEIKQAHPTAEVSFIQMDLSSLRSVKDGVLNGFKHDRLDILMNNAGIVAKPPTLSVDGYENQFATNHLGHAMLTQQLLPFLQAAASDPDADVRIVTTTSDGYEFHKMIQGGISFSELNARSTMSRTVLGGWVRYGQSKLANILFASEFARRYPNITSVSIHPGVVETPMNTDMDIWNKTFVNVANRFAGIKMVKVQDGALNQLWCAVGAKKGELRNGGFYRPVGVDATDKLTKQGKSEELAKQLWEFTDGVLAKL